MIRNHGRSPEPPLGWHKQDWLLILATFDHYAFEGRLTEGQECLADQFIELIDHLHDTASPGAI